MKDKVFILGLGCQKGGSTWLHRQLQSNQRVDMGVFKEYHVFDQLDRIGEETAPKFVENLQNKLEQLRLNENFGEKYNQLSLRMSFFQDTEKYYNYFEKLWGGGGSSITHVGDITPAYATLSQDVFQRIKSEFHRRGFTLKVIFVMRDPIDRCWSAARMHFRKKVSRGLSSTHYDDEISVLKTRFKSAIYQQRTRYETTIGRLEEVFASKDLFFCLYENLFEPSTLSDLKKFLDIDDLDFDTSRRYNSTECKVHTLDATLEREIFDFYSDTYRFCAVRFNAQEIWRGYQYEA